MQFILMIHEAESNWSEYTEAEAGAILGGYKTFTDNLVASGAMRGGERLQPTSTATTVRVRDGETLLTDGPFTETKEQFGGFYLIDVEDLDAALKVAAQIPTAESGSIEVRPVWVMEDHG